MALVEELVADIRARLETEWGGIPKSDVRVLFQRIEHLESAVEGLRRRLQESEEEVRLGRSLAETVVDKRMDEALSVAIEIQAREAKDS